MESQRNMLGFAGLLLLSVLAFITTPPTRAQTTDGVTENVTAVTAVTMNVTEDPVAMTLYQPVNVTVTPEERDANVTWMQESSEDQCQNVSYVVNLTSFNMDEQFTTDFFQLMLTSLFPGRRYQVVIAAIGCGLQNVSETVVFQTVAIPASPPRAVRAEERSGFFRRASYTIYFKRPAQVIGEIVSYRLLVAEVDRLDSPPCIEGPSLGSGDRFTFVRSGPCYNLTRDDECSATVSVSYRTEVSAELYAITEDFNPDNTQRTVGDTTFFQGVTGPPASDIVVPDLTDVFVPVSGITGTSVQAISAFFPRQEDDCLQYRREYNIRRVGGVGAPITSGLLPLSANGGLLEYNTGNVLSSCTDYTVDVTVSSGTRFASSNTLSFRTLGPDFDAPVIDVDFTPNRIVITWEDVSASLPCQTFTYDIHLARSDIDNDPEPRTIIGVSSPYVITGVENCASYNIYLNASAQGITRTSDIVEITTNPPKAPSAVNIIASHRYFLDVFWRMDSDAYVNSSCDFLLATTKLEDVSTGDIETFEEEFPRFFSFFSKDTSFSTTLRGDLPRDREYDVTVTLQIGDRVSSATESSEIRIRTRSSEMFTRRGDFPSSPELRDRHYIGIAGVALQAIFVTTNLVLISCIVCRKMSDDSSKSRPKCMLAVFVILSLLSVFLPGLLVSVMWGQRIQETSDPFYFDLAEEQALLADIVITVVANVILMIQLFYTCACCIQCCVIWGCCTEGTNCVCCSYEVVTEHEIQRRPAQQTQLEMGSRVDTDGSMPEETDSSEHKDSVNMRGAIKEIINRFGSLMN